MRFDILTIFPAFFTGPLDYGVLKRAIATGLVEVKSHDLRAFTHDRHRTVDDRPFGGGEGMVLKPEPIWECFQTLGVAAKAVRDTARETVVLLSAQGRPFNQAMAQELAGCERVVLLCGRYEGIDERINEMLCDREVSIGDYVLSGGELAAAVVLDAVVRLLPGVLGNPDSARFESFGTEASSANSAGVKTGDGVPSSVHLAGGLLDYPHYTRPAEFLGAEVPAVLQGGNHDAIRTWRRQRALEKTLRNRPELLERATLTREDREFLLRLERREAAEQVAMNADDQLAEHIRMMEEKMLESSFRKNSREFAELLTDDFVEFGSSGRAFDKAAILRELSDEAPVRLALREFDAVMLAEDAVQATYVSTRERAGTVIESLRSSIWVRREGVWRIRFHQGTRRRVEIPPIA